MFTFFLSLRLLKKENKGHNLFLESFRFIFFGRNRFSIFTKRCFERYCTTMDFDISLISLFFPVYLLKQAILEMDGVFEDKGKRFQYWLDRLNFYVKNRENFILEGRYTN
jgi:hypothetical protein